MHPATLLVTRQLPRATIHKPAPKNQQAHNLKNVNSMTNQVAGGLQYSLCGPGTGLDAHAAHAVHDDLPALLCAHVLLHDEVVVVAKHGLGVRTQDQHAICSRKQRRQASHMRSARQSPGCHEDGCRNVVHQSKAARSELHEF